MHDVGQCSTTKTVGPDRMGLLPATGIARLDQLLDRIGQLREVYAVPAYLLTDRGHAFACLSDTFWRQRRRKAIIRDSCVLRTIHLITSVVQYSR